MKHGLHMRFGRKRPPEDSLPLRLSILACVLVAELTVLAMGYYGTVEILLVPALTAAGFAFSWRTRRSRNLAVKVVLSLAVILLAALFVRELAASMYDTRLPLVKLLLWLQVLHSFDMPSRKDLKFSLASSATLVAAAAVLSTGTAFVLGLAAFSAAAVTALVYLRLSEEGEREGAQPVLPGARVARLSLSVWLAGLATAALVLVLMPQNLQARLLTLPVSDLQHYLGDFSGEVINPYYQDGGDPFSRPPQFSSESYYGFNPYMDLRARGKLDDDVVMKVKSSTYDYYRGAVFDLYNGKGWEVSDSGYESFHSQSPPIELDTPGVLVPDARTEVESFYIERDLTNIIFSGWRPVSLYFPGDQVKMDRFYSLRSPYQLTAGTVYSVVVERPLYDTGLLRRLSFPLRPDEESRYLQLPPDQHGDLRKVRELAEEVTAPYDDRYDKAAAIERYLQQNYRYDLDVPPQQRDMDAVAYFLFQERAGYCEHFASAMAVMARSVGIPARVVTGYTGGEYNPLTAMWEVRGSDAHAWVEIDFGPAGWVPFDPTPGFAVPAGDSGHGPWIAGRLFSYLGGLVGGGRLGSLASALGGVADGIASVARAAPVIFFAALVLALLTLAAGARAALSRRQRRTGGNSGGREDPVLERYLDAAGALAGLGLTRRPDETLAAFSRRVGNYLGREEFAELSAMVERRRYGEYERHEDRRRAAQLAKAVKQGLDRHQSLTGTA